MSYCRFSTDDYASDVYIYADAVADGFTTHVAASRFIFPEPLPPPVPFDDETAWVQRAVDVQRMADVAEREPIHLPHAGETFWDATPADVVARLEALARIGFRVPASAVAALRAEAAVA